MHLLQEFMLNCGHAVAGPLLQEEARRSVRCSKKLLTLLSILIVSFFVVCVNWMDGLHVKVQTSAINMPTKKVRKEVVEKEHVEMWPGQPKPIMVAGYLKQWYRFEAPPPFEVRKVPFGNVICSKKPGQDLVKQMMGRVVSISSAELFSPMREDQAFKWMKLRITRVDLPKWTCYSEWEGMHMESTKRRGIIRKWSSTIECHQDVKTLDGYHYRIIALGITQRYPNQIKKGCYAHTSKEKAIRAKMKEIINADVSNGMRDDLIKKLLSEYIEREMEKQCKEIHPIVCYIRKVTYIKESHDDALKKSAKLEEADVR